MRGKYRLVSLTSIVVKVLESIVRDAIVDHMMANGVFSDDRHGFVPGSRFKIQDSFIWSSNIYTGVQCSSCYS